MLEASHNIETRICKFIDHDITPNYLFDIGVGSKSEYISLSKKYPKMLSIGLEPCPLTFARLISVFPGILLPYGVWNEETYLDLYFSKSNLDAASVYAVGRDENTKIYAKTLNFIDHHIGYQDRILLWIDVEGSELMALEGGDNLLKSGRVNWINIAVRNKWTGGLKGATRDEIHQYLTKFGYREKLLYNHHNKDTEFWRCDAIYIKS